MFLTNEELEKMDIDEIRQHLKDVEAYVKQIKENVKNKRLEKPLISLFIRKTNNQYYVYTTFQSDSKRKKQEYLGRYGEPGTYDKVKELAKDRPRLLQDYEKLKEKVIKTMGSSRGMGKYRQ